MKKFWMMACGLAACLALTAFASAKTVYVADGGTGDGSAAAAPCGTLAAAVEKLGGAGGEVALVGDTTVSGTLELPEQSGDLTLTAQNGARLVLAADLAFAKNTNDNLITIDCPITVTKNGGAKLFGGFNNLRLTESVTVAGDLDFFGGMATDPIADGDRPNDSTAQNLAVSTELPYSITVEGGTYRTFAGGNYRAADTNAWLGSIAAPLTVTIRGGSFGGGVSYTADAPMKNENAFSLSGMSILCDDATLTVEGGVFHLPIYAQGRLGRVSASAFYCADLQANDKDFYAIDGDISMQFNGGTFDGCEVSAYQNGASATQLLRGNFDVTVGAGASFANGVVFDATQVKAYAGQDKAASFTGSTAGRALKRFDNVNGAAQTYEEPLRVAFVGDSITEGVGAGYANAGGDERILNGAFASQFLSKAVAAGKDVIIGNYGVGGSTVSCRSYNGHADTLAYTLSIYEADADVVIIGLGTNDAQATGGTAGAAERFENEYTDFVSAYGQLPTTKKVYATTAIYRKTSSPAQDIRAVSLIRPLQKRVLAELAKTSDKYQLIDLYALLLDAAVNDTLFASDKLHPSAAGYTIYADKLYDAVFSGVYTVPDFGRSDIYISDSGKLNGAGTADDPISSLTVALGMAKPTATLHLVGTVTYPSPIYPANTTSGVPLPIDMEKLTIVGEGNNAAFVIRGDTFRMQSATVLDNFKLSATKALYVTGEYNDIEVTDTFTNTVGSGMFFFLGYRVWYADAAEAAYDSVPSVSSDRDVTAHINGGTWSCFNCGNYRLAADAVFGTYSGKLKATLGKNATVNINTYNGALGMNYLTGSIDLTVGGTWKSSVICENTPIAITANVAAGRKIFDQSKNTGSITVTKDGVGATVYRAYDFDGDGKITLSDALQAIRYAIDGCDDALMTRHYYNFDRVDLAAALHIMRLLSRD